MLEHDTQNTELLGQLQSEIQAARLIANEGMVYLLQGELFPLLNHYDKDSLFRFQLEARVSFVGIQEKLFRAGQISSEEIQAVRNEYCLTDPESPAPWYVANDQERSVMYSAQDGGYLQSSRIIHQSITLTVLIEQIAAAERRLSSIGLNGHNGNIAIEYLRQERARLATLLIEQSAKLNTKGEENA